LAGFINIHAKCASLPHRECHVGRVNFVQISFAQFSHPKIDAAFREAHLNNICIQVQEGKRSHAAHMDARLARLQLSAPEVLDISQETQATRRLYGLDEKPTEDFGKRCLLARRLIERPLWPRRTQPFKS
jgi:hypothetical protein